ncbi:MAG: PHP domain-containing protein [Clostridia bacterium]|nr:PHP domain-containing protein [Clostridia bacterium]
MILTADYHTHTPYSHGKNTVAENVAAAKEIGLREIGITDHGFSHLAFGLKRKKIQDLKDECKKAEEEYGVKVLVGVEANICGDSGKTDCKEEDYDDLDLFVCGKHVLIAYENLKGWYRYFGGNFIVDKFGKKPSEKLVQYNTKAYIETIKNNPVDIISHINYLCPCDVKEVAKCAADYGTYIELNAKKQHLTDEQLVSLLATNARFVVDSDAHSAGRVGEVKLVEEQLKRVNFPMDRIDNIDGRTPNFRFAAFKKSR